VLLLLQRSGGKFRIARLYLGAFDISQGILVPLTKKHGFAEDYGGLPVNEAIPRMLAILNARKPG
jgi:hypothetical protein